MECGREASFVYLHTGNRGMELAETNINAGEQREGFEEAVGYAGSNMLYKSRRMSHLLPHNGGSSSIVEGIGNVIGAESSRHIGMEAKTDRITTAHSTFLGEHAVKGVECHPVQLYRLHSPSVFDYHPQREYPQEVQWRQPSS